MAGPAGTELRMGDTAEGEGDTAGAPSAPPRAPGAPPPDSEDGCFDQNKSLKLKLNKSIFDENVPGNCDTTTDCIDNIETEKTLQDNLLNNCIKNEIEFISEDDNECYSDLKFTDNNIVSDASESSQKVNQIIGQCKDKLIPNDRQNEIIEMANNELVVKTNNDLNSNMASLSNKEGTLSNETPIQKAITVNCIKINPNEDFGDCDTASITISNVAYSKKENTICACTKKMPNEINKECNDLKNLSIDMSITNKPNCALISCTQHTNSTESESGTNASEQPNINSNKTLRSDSEIFTIDSDTNITEEISNNNDINTENLPNFLLDKEAAFTNNASLNSDHSRSIAGSSVSLDDHDVSPYRGRAINRSPLSKSAENINLDTTNSSTSDETKFSLSSLDGTEKMDQDKILADFEAHKSKVPLLSKIPEIIQHDRFPRSNKEIITQDFGNIVKNVHGIFSSVSGSLKNAYNISQRNTVQNKQMNNKILTTGPLKNAATGNILNSIFDSGDQIDGDITKLTHQECLPIFTPKADEKDKNHLNMEEPTKREPQVEEDGFKLECLEQALLAERQEVAAFREKVRQQADEIMERERINKEVENKMELLRKRLEQSEREKDAAVMRYAVSERAIIGARESAESARRGEKAARTEMELLVGKLKSAQAEKQRICQIYDDKCHELSTSERELARLKEELKEMDGKLKWTQGKLRVELEAYKEAAASTERLTKQVAELQARETDGSDTAKTKQLESDLKEAQASLILCRHDNVELDRRLTSTAQQLEACRRELTAASATVGQLQEQVENLSASNLRLEEEAAELASLRARAALADTLATQLQRETERATLAEEETARERARAETCARRESSALEHSARLTAEHVGERAQHQHLEAKARALSADNASLREKLSSLEVEVTELRGSLSEETVKRRKECQLLARKVAELTEEVQQASKELEWEKGENSVLKKRHASAVKELNRELQRALKRCEQLEARSAQSEPADATSTRTGSISSLSSCDGPAAAAGEEPLVNGHGRPDTVPEIQVREPDRQALIERIVQLQRVGARRAERCDFLEEHNRQLTAELSKKAKLLRQLLASQPAGALAGQSHDDNKREMARLGGGAMAAVWGGAADGLTPELSLEINRKLQAVLEDALLKNITLKENMDTLGAEIARLKAAQSQRAGAV